MARTGNGCLSYGYDSNNDGNDWAMLDPINVEPGYYVLKFWYSNLQSYPEKLAVYWGNEATPEAMTNKIVEYAPFSVDVYSESVNIIHFDKAQTIYLGFYAFSEKNQNLILIDDVSFDKIESETGDLALSDLQNVPDFVRESSSKDVKFNIGNGGISEVNAKINVSIDDVVVKESEAVARPQVLTEITINDVLVDLSDGNHTLKVEVVNDNEGIADNNVLTKDFTVVSKPAKFWNFENGQLPAEFTFRAEDGGTVTPAAGDEFNEDGWGLFNIVEHEVFGEYLLAGTSWLNGTDQADRWLILPQVCIDGPDSYFVWDGYSYNKTYLEDYQIMVSESDDNTASFTELLTVEDESIEPKTRGISLADYAGKDIYIAIRLRTKSGDCLLLDNIGIYVDKTPTCISTVTDSNAGVVISANELCAADGVKSIALSDVSGRVLRTANANVISLSALPSGVYVATVKAADGSTKSYKFVRK